MMLVARMIMAKPSAIRLYTQPIASPPTMRSTNSETLRAPIASPCVQGRGSTECLEEAGTERLVHPTGRCEWAGGPHDGIGDRCRRFPLARTRFAGDAAVIQLAPVRRGPSRRCRRRLPRDLHTLVTIPALPSATVTVGSGSMIGTAITKVLRGPGAALSILVLCATPAAAQFSFPFGAPPPPNPVPAPNASPAPNAAARSQACLRLASPLAAVDRGAAVDPAKAEQIKRYEDAAPKQKAELDRLGQQSQRLGCQGGGFFALFSGQSPQCGPLNNQIQQMRANLDRTLTDIQ